MFRRLPRGFAGGLAGPDGQAASGPQTLIWARAVRVVMLRPALGNAGRALVLRSRCRSRSMVMRHLAIWVRAASRAASAGRLAVAVISRGWTGWPARRPLPAGTAARAAARPAARVSSTAVTQAACSWRTRSGDCERNIGPVEGPAPRIADLASRSAVSDPSHRHL